MCVTVYSMIAGTTVLFILFSVALLRGNQRDFIVTSDTGFSELKHCVVRAGSVLDTDRHYYLSRGRKRSGDDMLSVPEGMRKEFYAIFGSRRSFFIVSQII